MAEQHCPECGCILKNDEGKYNRSYQHLKLFFAFIEAAYLQWPVTKEWRPGSKEELRAWALIKAGHRHTSLYTFDTEEEAKLVCKVMEQDYAHERETGHFVWVVPFKEGGKTKGAAKMKAASIKFTKLDQSRFNEVSAGVITAIEDEAGIDFDAWRNTEGSSYDTSSRTIPGRALRREILRHRVGELRRAGESSDGAGEDRRPDDQAEDRIQQGDDHHHA